MCDRILSWSKHLVAPPATPWAVAGWLAVLVALHFFFGAVLLEETNRNRLASDQQHNIDLARMAADHVWPHHTKGVVNPLWPWLAAKTGLPDEDEDLFARGKWINLSLSAAWLCGLALWLRGRMGLLPLIGTSAAAGLVCLLPQAAYFQPETIYYLLFTPCWLLAVGLLNRPSLARFLALGLLLGFAYLAKASVEPFVAVFLLAGAVRTAWPARPREGDGSRWSPARFWVGFAMALAVAAAVVAPRAIYAWRVYGDPLHSYPKYWMWHDDFGRESVPFMVAHPGKKELEAMRPEEKPSAKNYLRTHSKEQAWRRLRDGLQAKLGHFIRPEGAKPKSKAGWKELVTFRGGYLFLLVGGVLVLGCAAAFREDPWWRDGGAVAGVALVVGACTLYALAYGWYHPIGRGDRFMMSLYLPVLLTSALALERLRRDGAAWFAFAHAAVWAVFLAALGVRLAQVLAWPHFAG